MNYNVGDKVRVESLEWYNKNKNKYGNIHYGDNRVFFESKMSKFCGSILTIKNIDIDMEAYEVEENRYYWTDDMIEGLAEETIQPVVFENIVFPNENYADKVELYLGNDYEIVVEDGRTFVQKKKPKYPKTYEECAKVLGYNQVMPTDHILGYNGTLLSFFQQLLICRDAYWKIAGEEMGLGKHWEPDWNESSPKYIITVIEDKLIKHFALTHNYILAFPTEEMSDVFYDNFKDLIEKCKELL